MRGILLGLSCAAMVACAMGGAKQSKVAAPPVMASDAGATGMPDVDAAHAEIAKLDQAIVDELAPRKISPEADGTCGASCDLGAVAMDTKPRTEDPRTRTCKPGTSAACEDSCTLSDSICKNADRICVIAHQLGDHDAFANDKCMGASATCQTSKQRCCTCL